MDYIEKGHFAHLKYVVNSNRFENVSWNASRYGSEFRGGTPFIKVMNVYLSLFHTKISSMGFFIGAVALCPNPPFNIHRISPHPIVRHGDPVFTYPMASLYAFGITETPDGKHVLVSMYDEERVQLVAKFSLAGLFAHMEVISHCDRVPNDFR